MSFISDDGNVAYAEVNLADRDRDQYVEVSEDARSVVDRTDVPDTNIELGGDIFVEPVEFSSESIGFVAAMIILLIAFGSVLAMGLPLLTALFGVATGIALLGLTVNVIGMPSFSNQAVAMIGIGVGIDYALFIVPVTAKASTTAWTPKKPRCAPSTPRVAPCCSPAAPSSSPSWACSPSDSLCSAAWRSASPPAY